MAEHDEVVKDIGPQNAKYTSPEIQNFLLSVMGSMVQGIICNSVRAAGPFSIMADECKDASKREQLAMAIRYVEAEQYMNTS